MRHVQALERCKGYEMEWKQQQKRMWVRLREILLNNKNSFSSSLAWWEKMLVRSFVRSKHCLVLQLVSILDWWTISCNKIRKAKKFHIYFHCLSSSFQYEFLWKLALDGNIVSRGSLVNWTNDPTLETTKFAINYSSTRMFLLITTSTKQNKQSLSIMLALINVNGIIPCTALSVQCSV